MKQTDYLITGASGFLGRLLADALKKKGAQVTGQGRAGQDLNLDITQPFSLPKDLDWDIIVHSAGKAHSVPRTAEEEQVFYQVNLEGTKNLCTAIEKLPKKPEAFVFISTVAVYGVDSGVLIPEDAPLNGTSPYAKSKILAEEWLGEWAEKTGIVLGILRLPLIAGPNPPGNLGAMINGIKSGRYLSIGKATARKSVVWAEDIADVIPKLASVGGTYNLTDGYHPSFGELERTIADSLGKKAPIKIPMVLAKVLGYAGDLLGDRFPVNSDKLGKITSTLTFDDSKARQLLAWEPGRVLDRLGRTR